MKVLIRITKAVEYSQWVEVNDLKDVQQHINENDPRVVCWQEDEYWRTEVWDEQGKDLTGEIQPRLPVVTHGY